MSAMSEAMSDRKRREREQMQRYVDRAQSEEAQAWRRVVDAMHAHELTVTSLERARRQYEERVRLDRDVLECAK